MNPIGDPPEYAGIPGALREGRMPNRWELDRVSPANPVYIRAPWGYWPNKIPLLSCANSLALAHARIDRDTVFPSPLVTIDRDPVSGEPNGVFLENTREPILEFTAFAMAPNFTIAQRSEALALSMETYNSVGTTSVFEGHGVSADVVAAYQEIHRAGRQTLRAHLVFSPTWGGMGESDIRAMLGSWARWIGRRGLGDAWLRVAGIYTEIDETPESRMRARIPVQTGWAGYSPDAGLPRKAVLELMMEAARNDVRVSGIWASLLDLFAEVNARIPIAGKRWILGHQRVFTDEQIRLVKDLGLVLTTHTNRHVYKQGSAMRWRVGPGKEHTIVPIPSLLDAGVPVAFGTDGLPPSLFMPIWQAVERIDRETGDVIGPSQRISRIEALRCATRGGAYLTFEEGDKGTLEAGRLADFVVLSEDPLTVEADRLSQIVAELTYVDGREVYRRSTSRG
jgi:predicted amidohydrolase YtcJ